MMQPSFLQPAVSAGEAQLAIYGVAFGSTQGNVTTETGLALGSNIPAGLFVVYSPDFASGALGSCTQRAFILPESEGKLLLQNDRVTTLESSIAQAKDANGLFRFVGVSGKALYQCLDACNDVVMCCPFGYSEPQHTNAWQRLKVMDVVTSGAVVVYNETDVSINDPLYVRVTKSDADCQYFGALTTDAIGTQPLSGVRIMSPAKAGAGVWVQLGGL